jgi:DNA-binding IclR family transcriptional regulator
MVVKSASRVLELLELFEAERRALRVAEIVEKLGMPQSSVSMLLKTLMARGYMEFDASKRTYCPSVRVAFLCDWVARQPEGDQALQHTMQRLASETGETILLGRQAELQLQYVSIIESRFRQHSLRFSPWSGTMRPMHLTAIGIMLLSKLEDERISLLLRRYNAEVSGPPAKIGETFRAIELARKQGYYESGNLATLGAGVIATLLPTPVRTQQLGIGIGAPVARLHERRKEYLSILMGVAAQAPEPNGK